VGTKENGGTRTGKPFDILHVDYGGGTRKRKSDLGFSLFRQFYADRSFTVYIRIYKKRGMLTHSSFLWSG